MPQPIRRTCHAEVSGLLHRPEHAAILGQIVGVSGRLENALGWLLALLSQGSASITIPMFQAVVSTDAQRAMLLAAADQALTGPEKEAFHDLMEDFRPRYRERSLLVHNLWGHSNDHPDKALWWRASDLGSIMAQIATDPTRPTEDLSLKAMTYTLPELRGVLLRLDEYLTRVNALITDLWNSHPRIAAATSAATNATPMSTEPQLDLPPPQTEPESDQPEAPPAPPDPAH